ncbi:protease La [Haemophilus influenzae]|uniref:Protease La n=1 Tax=Haemophilus influenzae TaxID=727 RepID=A0A2X1PQT0_HAEIF|nr:protease La [Haemophilus influenzae]
MSSLFSQQQAIEQSLNWQALQPDLVIQDFPLEPVDFWALQPNATQGIDLFLRHPTRSLLMMKVGEPVEYAELLQNFISQNHHKVRSIFGVNYVIEQGDSFSFPHVYTEPAKSLDDNFASQGEALSALYCDQFQLFGSFRIHPSSQDIQLVPGLVHKANGGVLILSAATLLSQFDLWGRLKQILQTQTFDWYSAHPFKNLPCDIPSYALNLKVIVLGNRTELATFG